MRAGGRIIVRGRANLLSIHPCGVRQLGRSHPAFPPVGDCAEPFPCKDPIRSVMVEMSAGHLK